MRVLGRDIFPRDFSHLLSLPPTASGAVLSGRPRHCGFRYDGFANKYLLPSFTLECLQWRHSRLAVVLTEDWAYAQHEDALEYSCNPRMETDALDALLQKRLRSVSSNVIPRCVRVWERNRSFM